MGDVLKLDYYYGIEADQFSFYRVPRLLIKDPRFKDLSSDAKLLYGLMLDRMSMSMKNGWFDKENRAYIYYTLDNVMEDLGCAREKASKVISEIDSKKGIGLIEKKRQGLGRPDIIYVKNFATIEATMENIVEMRGNADDSTEVRNPNFLKFDNGDSRNSDSQEVRKPNYRDNEKRTTRSSEIELQEVRLSEGNYNENKYKQDNYNNQISLSLEREGVSDDEKDIPAVDINKMDMMDEVTAYINLIKQNIEYDHVMNNEMGFDKRLYQEIFEIIVDVVLGKRKTIMIGNAEYPYEVVKSRFLKLNCGHIEYVIDKVTHNTGEIRNIRAYLIASLYNAPTTETTYFSQMVHHDMYGGGWQEKGII